MGDGVCSTNIPFPGVSALSPLQPPLQAGFLQSRLKSPWVTAGGVRAGAAATPSSKTKIGRAVQGKTKTGVIHRRDF